MGPCERIEGLEHIDKVISIDQAPIGRTPRSNPATTRAFSRTYASYTPASPDARARRLQAGPLLVNVKGGRCEACQGDGVLRVEMHFLPDVYVTCDSCAGRRYNRETLEVKLPRPIDRRRTRSHGRRSRRIVRVHPAHSSEADRPAPSRPRLHPARQPATTLSGGEAQRVKLAANCRAKPPAARCTCSTSPPPACIFRTSSYSRMPLRPARCRQLGAADRAQHRAHRLRRLGDRHGPRGRKHGGSIVVAGTPEEVARTPGSPHRALSQGRRSPTSANRPSKPLPPSEPAKKSAKAR